MLRQGVLSLRQLLSAGRSAGSVPQPARRSVEHIPCIPQAFKPVVITDAALLIPAAYEAAYAGAREGTRANLTLATAPPIPAAYASASAGAREGTRANPMHAFVTPAAYEAAFAGAREGTPANPTLATATLAMEPTVAVSAVPRVAGPLGADPDPYRIPAAPSRFNDAAVLGAPGVRESLESPEPSPREIVVQPPPARKKVVHRGRLWRDLPPPTVL